MNSKKTNVIVKSLTLKKDQEITKEQKEEKDPLLNNVFFSKYKTLKKLGEGSFGKVYKAIYDGKYFALKMEDASLNHNLLENEAILLEYLKGPNIPKYEEFGFNKEYHILVMQLLDKSLDYFFHKLKPFSIKTTAILGYQMINILKYIHNKHIIHRDIKPDNFAMGLKELNATLYIVDFGLAKKFRSSKTLKQLPLTKKKKLTGTARYASINALQGYEQSRRDDLESVGYVLMYFLRGNLPWQNLKVKNKDEKYQKIWIKKKETSSQELGKNLPSEFAEILDYFKKMEYTEDPDYEMCCSKLLSILEKDNSKLDFVYDWTTNANLKERTKLKKNKKHNKLTLANTNKVENNNFFLTNLNIKNDKNIIFRNFTNPHVEDIENVEEVENEKVKTINIEENKKKTESDISNKANIDEFDSPCLQPTNETKCCQM